MTLYKDLAFEHLIQDLVPALEQENRNQIQKWGYQKVHLFEWLAWATEEFGELAKAINDFSYKRCDKQEVIKEGIQAATLILKIVETVENGGV
jgi:NTP pyrophosphatase (non-canonical NTP hydrolase)